MAGLIISTRLRAAFAATTIVSLAAAASWALAQQSAPPAAPAPASAATVPAPALAGKPAAAKPLTAKPAMASADKALWKTLTPPQQTALAPLAAEWDKMDAARKLKWMEIANRFSSMKPDEQARVHEKMREWMRLTPEERRKVRENYTATKKIDKDQKTVQWEQYQQLTDEQKKQLVNDTRKKTPVTNLPAKNQVKPVAPVKSGKLVPEVVCPAGTIKNPAAAMPACVKAPEPVVAPPADPAAVPAASALPGAINVAPAPVTTPPVNPAVPVTNVK